MNGDRFERWLLPMAVVLCLALGAGMTLALSLYHANGETATVSAQ